MYDDEFIVFDPPKIDDDQLAEQMSEFFYAIAEAFEYHYAAQIRRANQVRASQRYEQLFGDQNSKPVNTPHPDDPDDPIPF